MHLPLSHTVWVTHHQRVVVVEDEPDIGLLLTAIISRGGVDQGDVVLITSDFPLLLVPSAWEGVTHALVDQALSGEVTGCDIARVATASGVSVAIVTALPLEDVPCSREFHTIPKDPHLGNSVTDFLGIATW